ncbi:MAG: FAD-linked oxidase C-terminal domain-containing protein [Chloroflexota bacterium]|jgi:glycolate oxidase|nr:MAG: FAD-binding protein [SAR202 cluster bacterium]MCH2671037.1 FAD-binding protein [Dehalococcoidia bacterium]MED5208184.1 FAD-linked oxidase C-terminal domain-containing protein [Chloroflexota bacterium]GIS93648.1 MAG: lactate dehydrogenase [Dehalococcoidia bacterium]|tara:strand:- start:7476 stop:8915 length:1440 start_codon:yes stop_codon:yes gene_type:complete
MASEMEFSVFLKGLQRIVGEQNVVYHSDDLLVFEYDGSIDRRVPEAVVFPSNTREVSEVISLAYSVGIPVVGRGTGTGLSGGSVAPPGGIQIAFPRMNNILEVDTDNQIALVEPGVINLHLDTRVRKDNLRYAPDPSSQKACSLGGNIAENSGGPHCLAYGTTTNHVLGMEVVLEDGSIVNLGSLARETIGYDLRGVFTGSEGTFGIATKIAVRLLPVPEAVRTFLGIFPNVESACTAVSAIIEHGIVPAALEMIDALTIQAVQNVSDAGYPDDAGAVLLIELEGLNDEIIEIGHEVEAALWDTGATQVRTAEAAEERQKLWAGRNGALGALGSVAPNYFLVDGVVPRTQLARVLGEVTKISNKYDIPIANVFHAGDGNLHPCLLFDERQAGMLERVMEAGTAVLQVCVDAGGTLTGEHGVGLEKKEQMPLVYSDEDMAAMVMVRDAFAPNNTLNPGKIFPDGVKSIPQSQPTFPGMPA